MQRYALPPLLPIVEPTCAPGEVVRTDYQEISTSAALPVAAGELDAGTGSEVEKIFDFSDNPIPVNATDLFIQVAYRGMMGDDADTVALGTLDAREPTFATFWNNTDYWWNDSNWGSYNSTYPNDSAKDFWVCAGASPSSWCSTTRVEAARPQWPILLSAPIIPVSFVWASSSCRPMRRDSVKRFAVLRLPLR